MPMIRFMGLPAFPWVNIFFLVIFIGVCSGDRGRGMNDTLFITGIWAGEPFDCDVKSRYQCNVSSEGLSITRMARLLKKP
jgi:hypothetical protein